MILGGGWGQGGEEKGGLGRIGESVKASLRGGESATHDRGVGGGRESTHGGVLGEDFAGNGIVGTVVCSNEDQLMCVLRANNEVTYSDP